MSILATALERLGSVAERLLHERGVFPVPDIRTNAGEGSVSYFEWLQDLQLFSRKEDAVNPRRRDILTGEFQRGLP